MKREASRLGLKIESKRNW